MKCEYCDSDTGPKPVRKQHWLRGKLYIVENATAEICPECGERCFHATTLDKIDRMITEDRPVKEILSVEVVRV
jgi:YgiT-type zinc finger domain-containing protein